MFNLYLAIWNSTRNRNTFIMSLMLFWNIFTVNKRRNYSLLKFSFVLNVFHCSFFIWAIHFFHFTVPITHRWPQCIELLPQTKNYTTN